MAKAPSPRRYSQAVFQIAVERDELDTWMQDLSMLAVALEDGEFSGLLDAPQVPAVNKVSAIRDGLSGSVSPLALNLLCLLASRNMAHLLPGILEQYGGLVDTHRGIERAEVVSAVPLESGQQAKIAEVLGGLVGKDIRLSSFVDPQVLGGLSARVGDRVIDGTVRSKFAEMRRRLVGQGS